MKRFMQYFCIGLMFSFQLTAQASVREIATISMNLDGVGNFKIINNFAYITLGSSGLKFFSLSTPNEIGECSNQVVRCQLLGKSVNHIDVVGNYMYLTTDHGLEILEQISSSRAERIGALPISDARKIVVQNDLAYVIVGEKQVDIINIANRNSPKRISSYKSDEGGFDKIVVSGNYMYLTGASVKHYFIVDISNSLSPKQFPRFTVNEDISNLIVIGNYLYVIGSYVSIFDISVPSSPKKLILPNPLYFPSLSNIIVQDKYAYFIGSNELSIMDITNPKNPITKERYSFPNSLTYKVGVSGDYIYLADKTSLKKLQFEPVALVCNYSVTPNNLVFEDYVFDSPSNDGTGIGNLEIKTNSPYCEWTAKTTQPNWLYFLTEEDQPIETIQGIGNATIKYKYNPNSDYLVRNAQITVANQVVNISQRQAQGALSFDSNSESMLTYPTIESKYVKVYREGETVQPITLTFQHYYDQLKRTDLWLMVHLPFKVQDAKKRETDWLYKVKPFETGLPFGFAPTIDPNSNNLFINKPFSATDENSNSIVWMDKPLEWTVLPLLSASGGFHLPKGEYTFYAIATIRGEDKKTSPPTPIYYNPIVHYNDLTILFSNLAIFKLIIQ